MIAPPRVPGRQMGGGIETEAPMRPPLPPAVPVPPIPPIQTGVAGGMAIPQRPAVPLPPDDPTRQGIQNRREQTQRGWMQNQWQQPDVTNRQRLALDRSLL